MCLFVVHKLIPISWKPNIFGDFVTTLLKAGRQEAFGSDMLHRALKMGIKYKLTNKFTSHQHFFFQIFSGGLQHTLVWLSDYLNFTILDFFPLCLVVNCFVFFMAIFVCRQFTMQIRSCSISHIRFNCGSPARKVMKYIIQRNAAKYIIC